jgi:hypothetical protein
MKFKRTLKAILKSLDQPIGIRAWLSDEPRLLPSGGFDLHGEKELDWGWVSANVPPGPGRALDGDVLGALYRLFWSQWNMKS